MEPFAWTIRGLNATDESDSDLVDKLAEVAKVSLAGIRFLLDVV
jgi:hypothetical protein